MAGIGFELRAVLHGQRGPWQKLAALVAAAAITSGPWLLSLLTLLLLGIGDFGALRVEQRSEFQALVTHGFAWSLVVVSAVQMPFTRHLADALYARRVDELRAAMVAALPCCGLLLLLVGLCWSWLLGAPPLRALGCTTLVIALGGNWLTLVWLTALRRHGPILLGYGLGLLAALLLCTPLSARLGIDGALLGFAGSQGLTFVLLVTAVQRGTVPAGRLSFAVLGAPRRFPALVAVGLCYGLAIWADKVVFWLGDGQRWGPWLCTHPGYDAASFVGYLTVVPALAFHLIHLETRFHTCYQGFYGAILGGEPLAQIRWQKERMALCLRDGAAMLLRWQGLCSALAIVFAPELLSALQLDVSVKAFRLCCVGAFCHVLLLIAMLVLLYFDLRGRALLLGVVFLAANTALAGWSILHGPELHGAGYAMAAFGALVLGFLLLAQALGKLEYTAFARQVRASAR